MSDRPRGSPARPSYARLTGLYLASSRSRFIRRTVRLSCRSPRASASVSRTIIADRPRRRSRHTRPAGTSRHDSRLRRRSARPCRCEDARQYRPAAQAGRNRRASVEPEIPACATITQWRPIITLWPICTRLSILVPSPITVSRCAPRSIVRVGADLDIVLDDDAADLRHFEVPSRPHGEAETVLSDPHAGMDDDAVADQRNCTDACGPTEQLRPMRTSGPITALGPILVPVADFRARTDDRAGIDHDAIFERASAWTLAPGDMPLAPNIDSGLHRGRKKRGENDGHARVADRRFEARSSLTAPEPHGAAARSKPTRASPPAHLCAGDGQRRRGLPAAPPPAAQPAGCAAPHPRPPARARR